MDVLVVEFEGTGRGIVRGLADVADAYARQVLPTYGAPYLGQGNSDVIREFINRGWNVEITVVDTPLIKDYL